MKKLLGFVTFGAVLLSGRAYAADPAPLFSDTFLRSALPNCAAENTIKQTPFSRTLPSGMSGALVTVESKGGRCDGQYLAVRSRNGNFFFGRPWLLEGAGTPEQKIKSFAWENFQEAVTPQILPAKSPDGLLNAKLDQTTEYGTFAIKGQLDPAATIFFPGEFRPLTDDQPRHRLEQLAPLILLAPSTGPADAEVSIVEFSDFQCPSCKHATTYLEPLLKSMQGKIRYTRIDLPLIANHPWAFSAAVAGRAVHRQNPGAFWLYKKAIYDNQADLNSFTLADFARNFAADHDLDLKKFDEDVNSENVRAEILDGIGTAVMLQVQATPSFMVNGVLVDPGRDGKSLEEYIGKELAKK